MYPRGLSLLCISFLILAGCGSDVGGSTGGGGPVQVGSVPASPTSQLAGNSAPVIQKGTTLRTPYPIKTAIDPRRTLVPTIVTPPTPTGPAFRLCSPLGDTSLEELRLIVSERYRPPPAGSEARHQGVDFAYFRKFNRAAIEGAGIQSILTGQVAAAVVDSFPYGNMLILETPAGSLPEEIAGRIHIEEGESLYVLYAHMERPPSLSLGDHVEACQPVGTVGKSGNAGGAHLHLETRLGPAGSRFSGMAYYKAWATDEQKANYLLWRTSGTFKHFDPMLLLTGE